MASYTIAGHTNYSVSLEALYRRLVREQRISREDIDARLDYFRKSIENGTPGGKHWRLISRRPDRPHLVAHTVDLFGTRIVLQENSSMQHINVLYQES